MGFRMPCDQKKGLASYSGPGYLQKPIYNMLKEYFSAIGKSDKLARNFRIKMELLSYYKENHDGPYSREYGGVHGVNWTYSRSWESRIAVTPEKNGVIRGKSMQTLRHEVMHSIVSGYLAFPGGAHGFKFAMGRGNAQGHPEFIITPDGRKLHIPSIIRGRWPSRVLKTGNFMIGNGYDFGSQMPREKVFINEELICDSSMGIKEND